MCISLILKGNMEKHHRQKKLHSHIIYLLQLLFFCLLKCLFKLLIERTRKILTPVPTQWWNDLSFPLIHSPTSLPLICCSTFYLLTLAIIANLLCHFKYNQKHKRLYQSVSVNLFSDVQIWNFSWHITHAYHVKICFSKIYEKP